MRGHYIESMYRQIISEEDTFLWLLRGNLKGQPESEILAAQDQALQATYHATKLLQTETGSKCRLLKQFGETVDLISMPNISKITINKET